MLKDNIICVESLREPLPLIFLFCLVKAIQSLHPERAIIFGSAVTKGLNGRDIDLLVISNNFRRILWQKRPRLLNLPLGPIYDLRLFTSVEFENLYPRGNPFREGVERKNIDLCEYYE